MKPFLIACVIALLPLAAVAQQPNPGYQGMDPAKMQEMMRQFQDPEAMAKLQRQAEATQRCMGGITQEQIDALQARAEAAGAEIDRLCAEGKKDEALRRGLELNREMQSDKTIKKIRECSKDLSDTMSQMPWAQMNHVKAFEDDEEPTKDDICS